MRPGIGQSIVVVGQVATLGGDTDTMRLEITGCFFVHRDIISNAGNPAARRPNARR